MITKEEFTKTYNELKNSGCKNTEIAFKLGISIESFYQYRRKFGLPNRNDTRYLRKFNVNDEYFSIPNEENCYWAGFIAADGTIINNKILTIKLCYLDIELLEKFLLAINSNNPIRRYKTKLGKDQVVITIYSKQICEDLKRNFGIIQNKTFLLKENSLTDKNLIDYYIKGYIDGDGCISVKKKNGITVHLTGTQKLLHWFNLRFSDILKRKANSLSKRSKSKIYQSRYDNKSGRSIFLHFYNLKFGLNRKWSYDTYNYCFNWKRKERF